MGIQRLSSALPPAQRSASSADGDFSSSGSRLRAPERQRGLWSFLTWPFILAPIAAAEAFVSHHGQALPTDQQEDSGGIKNHVDIPAPQGSPAVGSPLVGSEQAPDDGSHGWRLVDVSRGVVHDGHQSDQNHAVPLNGVMDVPNLSAGGGGGGGGGGGPDPSNETQAVSDGSQSQSTDSLIDTDLVRDPAQNGSLDEISKAIPHDILGPQALDHIGSSIGAVTGALVSEASTLIGDIPLTLNPALDHIGSSIGAVTGALVSEASTLISDIPLTLNPALDHIGSSIGAVTGALVSEASTLISDIPLPLNAVLDHIGSSIGAVTGALVSEASTLISDIPLPLNAALDHIGPSIGTVSGALVSEASTLISDIPIDVSIAPDDGPINLKDVVGFDLHLLAGSGAVAPEVALAPLGINLSHSIGDFGFVTHIPTVDSVHAVKPGISQEVDGLFATGQGLSDFNHLGYAASPNQFGLPKASDDLGVGGNSALGPLDVAGAPGYPPGVTLPTVQNVAAVVGDATDVTPGHSIEFSTPPPSSEGDALFQGNKYTDYHMALQTDASSVGHSASAAGILAPPVETPSLAQSDSSTVTQPLQHAIPEHQDVTPIHSFS